MLPDWPAGTVTILATAGEDPHAIPVSAAMRAGPRRALIALAGTRNSLARLRDNPRVSLTIMCEDTAVTAYGSARALDEHDEHDDRALPAGVVAVEIDVDRVEDHDRPTFEIESGVRWRWTDADAERRDADVRAGLARLADRARPS
jgi:Pyridoxamine 5'-phosphate oxidase